MIDRTIKRDGEQFVVALSQDKMSATVTDEEGIAVTIRYSAGNFEVRLPNGWGGWRQSMDASVDYAVRLSVESRNQLTAEQAYQEMFDYVEGKDD